MLKQAIVSTIVLLSALSTFSQQKDTVIAKAHYVFMRYKDSLKIGKPVTENFQLLLGKHSSVYKTADKKRNDSLAAADYVASGKREIHMIPYTKSEVYFYFKDHLFYTRERVTSSNFIVADPWPVISWSILPDTLSILGLKCQKATGFFKGRTYEVWFCPSIPFQVGPWKLNGLPGLIVDGADKKKEVQFHFAGYQTVTQPEVTFSLPADKRLSRTDLKKLQTAYKADPIGYTNSSQSNYQVAPVSNQYEGPPKGDQNPIEK